MNQLDKIRNIAIIAHVDHGKTTLVEKLMEQSGTINRKQEKLGIKLDSNALEQERGITILSKNTSVTWKDYRINIVDTPGHADFGGEVERVLSMVDCVLLLVDACDGPMPQTRFVTQKAFALGLKPIVVVNKIDRPSARPSWVVDQVFELFDHLGASEEQLDFPIVYASGIQGTATLDPDKPGTDLEPLFQMIIDKVAPPPCELEGGFQMQITSLDYSSYVGTIGVGRVTRGKIKPNTPVVVLDREGKSRQGKVLQVLAHIGLERVEQDEAFAGDIIAVTGIEDLGISDTICDKNLPEALPPLTVDEPTVSMTFQVNTSPFAGKEGKFVTSRQIRDRLTKELIHNVALRVDDTADADKFRVSGRGELHLAILIETMRREGFELAVSKPEVILKEIDGEIQEPYEMVTIEVEQNHQGSVMEELGIRKGELKDMLPDSKGRVRLDYIIPARGLIGFHTDFMTLTSGTGLIAHVFDHYGPQKGGDMAKRKNGVLIANQAGKAAAYALWNLQARGRMIIDPQIELYEGMIIGIHSRDNDLVVNAIQGKKLTNMRASGSDEAVTLTPPIRMSLEQALDFIENDELVEITPKNIRVRKKFLKEHERKRAN